MDRLTPAELEFIAHRLIAVAPGDADHAARVRLWSALDGGSVAYALRDLTDAQTSALRDAVEAATFVTDHADRKRAAAAARGAVAKLRAAGFAVSDPPGLRSVRKRADLMAQHFIQAHGMRAVIVGAGTGKPRSAVVTLGKPPVVVTSGNPAVVVKTVGKGAAVLWCATPADAEDLAAAIRREGATTSTARRMADLMGIRVANDAEVAARAAHAVKIIETQIGQMKARGELRAVNAAYRGERLRRAKLGLGMMPYAAYLRRFTIKMMYRAAAQSARQAARRMPRFHQPAV